MSWEERCQRRGKSKRTQRRIPDTSGRKKSLWEIDQNLVRPVKPQVKTCLSKVLDQSSWDFWYFEHLNLAYRAAQMQSLTQVDGSYLSFFLLNFNVVHFFIHRALLGCEENFGSFVWAPPPQTTHLCTHTPSPWTPPPPPPAYMSPKEKIVFLLRCLPHQLGLLRGNLQPVSKKCKLMHMLANALLIKE